MKRALWRLPAGLLALCLACGPATLEQGAPPQAEALDEHPQALTYDPLAGGIQWELEERFPKDTNGDGAREERFDPEYINPSGYNVTLSGCAAGTSVAYAWSIDGVTLEQPNNCQVAVRLPAQGVYTARLLVTEPAPGSRTAQYTTQVHVKDWVIVSLGDSYGAGEGAPDVHADWSIGRGPLWANQRCHRSFSSPSAQAALALEQSDKHSSVTYISFACSGATINRRTTDGDGRDQGAGVLDAYVGIEPVTVGNQWQWLSPQVSAIQSLAFQRPIDMLIMSAGGNDVGFGDILKNCVMSSTCYLTQEDAQMRETLLPPMPGRYDALAAELASLNVKKTYLVEYPALFQQDDGSYCDSALQETSYLGELLYIDKTEAGYLESFWQRQLQSIMQSASGRHGWNYVSYIFDDFRGFGEYRGGHGICATPANRWINNGYDAAATQGPEGSELNTTGKVHPNRRGYEVMARRLLNEMNLDIRWDALRLEVESSMYLGQRITSPQIPGMKIQRYELATLFMADAEHRFGWTGRHWLTWGPFNSKYWALFGTDHALGEPLGDAVLLKEGAYRQDFDKGAIVAHPTHGTFYLYGGFRKHYDDWGREDGLLGWPLSDNVWASELRDAGGTTSYFQGGNLYWMAGSGAIVVVPAPMRAKWLEFGGGHGLLGNPESLGGAKDGGMVLNFPGGKIYSHPSIGVHGLYGPILSKWGTKGWEWGQLGWPLSDIQVLPDGGKRALFQGGEIYVGPSQSTAYSLLHGPILEEWKRRGAQTQIGYPVRDEAVLSDGSRYCDFGDPWYPWEFSYTPSGGVVVQEPEDPVEECPNGVCL